MPLAYPFRIRLIGNNSENLLIFWLYKAFKADDNYFLGELKWRRTSRITSIFKKNFRYNIEIIIEAIKTDTETIYLILTIAILFVQIDIIANANTIRLRPTIRHDSEIWYLNFIIPHIATKCRSPITILPHPNPTKPNILNK